MKNLFMFFLFILLAHKGSSQYPNHPLPQYPEMWNSAWITHPDIDPLAHNLIHFRNKVNFSEKPDQFIIHISGDNRYRFFINGEMVGYGPQLSDMRHWRYETIDIAPYLKQGENILAVEVMNWGAEKSRGIMSFETGFLLQGHSEKEQIVNSRPENWKVYHNTALYEKPVYWRSSGEIVGGFYASNPTDSTVAAQYPWGWKTLEYNDEQWATPKRVYAAPKVTPGGGHGWVLQPRTTVIQESIKEPFAQIVRTNIEGVSKSFQFGEEQITIPANTQRSILIDQGFVTLGYPVLRVSGGNEASIKIKYSEALYDEKNQKGNRNEIEGKVIKGISDVYLLDGGENREFQPMWLRTFRFIEISVETADQPLVIEDYYNLYSASPFEPVAKFDVSDPIFKDVEKICWHGLRICAQDNLMSDAYYEQMQYVGDTRPHVLAYMSMTGDLTYFKSAMEQFNYSRMPDGNITSCYPLRSTFVHPTYSLIWIDMLHDLMMYDGDKEWTQQFAGEIQEVFDYYESIIGENGLVGESEYHMFIDWYLPKGGNSAANRDGNSSILTLNYAYTLKKAGDIMEWLGLGDKAFLYREQSRKYAEIVRKLCFDEEKGIYLDNPQVPFYDQRASILAVLTDAHSEEEKKILMNSLLDPNRSFDSEANLFYLFYLFEAMIETGAGDFQTELAPWKAILESGMSATPEKRIEQHPRSEVHPWTAHPVHYYYSLVAGIRPSSPGFETVSINPNPGTLKAMRVTYPTKQGKINMDLKGFNNDVKGTIELPDQMSGTFKWGKKSIKLISGINQIDF